MKEIYTEEIVNIPNDGKLSKNNYLVTVNFKTRIIKVKGPRGQLSKNLKHIDMELIKIGNSKIKIVVWHGKRKHIACIRTVLGHINNMIKGVTKVN